MDFIPIEFKFNENASLADMIKVFNTMSLIVNDKETYDKLMNIKGITFKSES